MPWRAPRPRHAYSLTLTTHSRSGPARLESDQSCGGSELEHMSGIEHSVSLFLIDVYGKAGVCGLRKNTTYDQDELVGRIRHHLVPRFRDRWSGNGLHSLDICHAAIPQRGSAVRIACTTAMRECERDSSATSTLCPILIAASTSAACAASVAAPRVLAAPFNEWASRSAAEVSPTDKAIRIVSAVPACFAANLRKRDS